MSNTEIISNKDVTAEIETVGAQLISLKKDGVEYIWQRDPRFWKGSAPILFPVVGRLKDGILTVDGKDYPMPKHGFARDMRMCVKENTGESVTFELKSNAETKKLYPWDFIFTVRYVLQGSCLKTYLSVKNTDEKDMIFGFGGHTGFNVPMFETDSFEDYKLEFEKSEDFKSNHVNSDDSISASNKEPVIHDGNTIMLKRNLFNNDALIFENINSAWVKLVNTDGCGIKFSYRGFPDFAVWTREEPYEANYVCLEPWLSMGFRDDEDTDIKNKYGMKTIKPGESCNAEFSAEILSR